MEITVDQMYQIENKGHEMGFLKKFMMENAGASAVRRLLVKFGNLEEKIILVFAGLGNNGGDALVMARHLAGHGARVKVILLGCPENIKTEESKWNWSILEKMKSVDIMSLTEFETDLKGFVDDMAADGPLPSDHDEFGDYLQVVEHEPHIIIDGILGTGITGEIREPFATAINRFNNLKKIDPEILTFAVDVPSGLNPQTGETANIYTKCDMTVTFHKMKQGIPKRKDLTGELFVEKIGIPPEAEIDVL
ncbi:NAD(P)H-hydrate epimerase [Candidatus Nitrosopelagicus sp.]|nr:NAD(P)H-hydrate epimerase [Candidatus Nitrosopelagicus sp.]